MENIQSIKILKKLSHSDTLLEGSVKLSFTQLVGESIAAISVPIEAILKLENVEFLREKAVRKCCFTYVKMDFSD